MHRHHGSRLREIAQLIARTDRDLVREVALLHALGANEQFVDRPGDRSREREPHHERHELNDEEQPADDREQEQQHLAKAEEASDARDRCA